MPRLRSIDLFYCPHCDGRIEVRNYDPKTGDLLRCPDCGRKWSDREVSRLPKKVRERNQRPRRQFYDR